MTEHAERVAQLFGERLREVRKKRGETVRSLGTLAGMSHAYVSELENGVKTPSLAVIVRLASALRCKVTDLVDVFNKHDLSTLIPPRK